MIPPGASSDELIIIIAKSCADLMSKIMTHGAEEAQEAEIEEVEQGRIEREEREIALALDGLDEALEAALG